MSDDLIARLKDGDQYTDAVDDAIREIEALRDRVVELEQEVAFLRVNPNFETLTRQALEIENRRIKGRRCIVMIDIDNLHKLNDVHGSQEPVNVIIRRAFDFRFDDLVLKANYASGDEIVFVLRADPEGFMSRLSERLEGEGLSATMAFEWLSDGDDLKEVCDRAIGRVYELKKKRGSCR